MATKSDNKISFDEHYGAIYGDRWPSLRTSLRGEAPKIWRINRYAFGNESSVWGRPNPDYDWAIDCVRDGDALLKGPYTVANPGLEALYRMDLASVLVARALGVKPGMDVLDLCAAPGGKLLVLADIAGRGGRFVGNELSRSRRFKLLSVIEKYLPAEVRAEMTVTGWDGTKVGLRQREQFDRILVDAPCSAEAHLVQRPSELERWTPARTRQLARRQYSILCSALLAVRPGGRIVYATCSLSPAENDGVVARLAKRKGEYIKILQSDSPLGQRTSFGWHILPDRDEAGPAYYSIIEKLGDSP